MSEKLCARSCEHSSIQYGDYIASITEIATNRALADNDWMQGLGDRIRARTRQLGMTDADVARRLDVASSRYSKWVLDQREPDYATLLRLCGVLACSPDDLLLAPGNGQSADDLRLAKCASALASLDGEKADLVVAMIAAAAEAARQA